MQYAFRPSCGGCNRPMRGTQRGGLCEHCLPSRHSVSGSNVCMFCKYNMECQARVELGIWIRCEWPDQADMRRLAIRHPSLAPLALLAIRKGITRWEIEAMVSKVARQAYPGGVDHGYDSMLDAEGFDEKS